MRPYLWTKGVSITNFFRVNLAWVLPTHKKKWRIQVFTWCWRRLEKPHGDYNISNVDPRISSRVHPQTGEPVHGHECERQSSNAIRIQFKQGLNRPDEIHVNRHKSGEVSVRSAYRMLIHTKNRRDAWLYERPGNSNPKKEVKAWTNMWKHNIPAKVKVFTWRLAKVCGQSGRPREMCYARTNSGVRLLHASSYRIL